MKLQAARLELPMLLVTKRATLKDLGTKDDIRAIGIPLSETLALTVNVDAKTSRILRSTGKASGLEFVVDYSDFRRVADCSSRSRKRGWRGMPTANTKFDAIVVKSGNETPPATDDSANGFTRRVAGSRRDENDRLRASSSPPPNGALPVRRTRLPSARARKAGMPTGEYENSIEDRAVTILPRDGATDEGTVRRHAGRFSGETREKRTR